MNFHVYIPARYGSTRLPGKPLADVGGRPLIAHVLERAQESGAQAVIVATDDERIADVVRAYGGEALLTAPDLPSGSDRIAAAAHQRGEPLTRVIVNLQGDEPAMPAAVIRQVALLAARDDCDIATVSEPLRAPQLFDPNVVKVVRDDGDRALYFSRAPIPWSRDEFANGGRTTAALDGYRRHVGIYGYRVGFLARYVAAPTAWLERLEALEQLRALAFGARVLVPDACAECGVGIDTPDDLAALRARFAAR